MSSPLYLQGRVQPPYRGSSVGKGQEGYRGNSLPGIPCRMTLETWLQWLLLFHHQGKILLNLSFKVSQHLLSSSLQYISAMCFPRNEKSILITTITGACHQVTLFFFFFFCIDSTNSLLTISATFCQGNYSDFYGLCQRCVDSLKGFFHHLATSPLSSLCSSFQLYLDSSPDFPS